MRVGVPAEKGATPFSMKNDEESESPSSEYASPQKNHLNVPLFLPQSLEKTLLMLSQNESGRAS